MQLKRDWSGRSWKNIQHETKRKNSKEKSKHGDEDRMQSFPTCLFEVLECCSIEHRHYQELWELWNFTLMLMSISASVWGDTSLRHGTLNLTQSWGTWSRWVPLIHLSKGWHRAAHSEHGACTGSRQWGPSAKRWKWARILIPKQEATSKWYSVAKEMLVFPVTSQWIY